MTHQVRFEGNQICRQLGRWRAPRKPEGTTSKDARTPTGQCRSRRHRQPEPASAAYYAFSTLLCTPCSLSQEVGTALGAQAGERRLGEIVTGAGFGTFRRVAETPFNMVLEAKV